MSKSTLILLKNLGLGNSALKRLPAIAAANGKETTCEEAGAAGDAGGKEPEAAPARKFVHQNTSSHWHRHDGRISAVAAFSYMYIHQSEPFTHSRACMNETVFSANLKQAPVVPSLHQCVNVCYS